jgi:NodT family efflux transporter outer membrane factor (OMF) lipoprotein
MRRPIPPRRPGLITAVYSGAITLTACAVGPNFHRPAEPATDTYTAQAQPGVLSSTATGGDAAPTDGGTASRDGSTPSNDDGTQTLIAGQEPPARWWQEFGSPALDVLVAEALHANPNVQAAEAALRQAQENVAAGRGAYFPQVQLTGDVSRNRNAVQVLAPTLSSGAPIFNLYTPQVSVSFVPDLFGANRRQVESLQASADASRDEYDAAYLTLAANVVTAAVQEAGLRAQIVATSQIIDIERESLQVMHRQLTLGAIAEADALAQEAALAQLETSLPPLHKALDQQRDMLAVLTGRLPSDPPSSQFELDAITLPPAIPLGVPSKLVERRPDVRAAEAQLHAATANVGVAIANMLPQITLSGSLGSVATQTAQIFSGQSEFWSAGASLSQTLFAGGTLLHRERAARAALDQAGAEYRATVLTAFQNVADALRALAADADAVRAADRAATLSEASLDIAKRQYELGAVSYLSLLGAQQTYQQAVVGRAQARTNRYVDTAALFQALGGSAPLN